VKYVIIPYKIGSQSAKRIKDGIIAAGHRCVRVRPDSRTYRVRPTDKIIYYGGTHCYPTTVPHVAINSVRWQAANKLTTLQVLKEAGLSTVEWTTNREEASQWQGTVVARHTLTGHSGQGIETYNAEENPFQHFPDAPLYTKYLKKTYECRVHVFQGRVIDAQIKRKKVTDRQEEVFDTTIRNIHTGWVYCREDFILPEPTKELSIQAVAAVGLDFGAVDLIYNKHYNKFFILEINTAPGLDGTTLSNYIQAFLSI